MHFSSIRPNQSWQHMEIYTMKERNLRYYYLHIYWFISDWNTLFWDVHLCAFCQKHAAALIVTTFFLKHKKRPSLDRLAHSFMDSIVFLTIYTSENYFLHSLWVLYWQNAEYIFLMYCFISFSMFQKISLKIHDVYTIFSLSLMMFIDLCYYIIMPVHSSHKLSMIRARSVPILSTWFTVLLYVYVLTCLQASKLTCAD